MRFLCLHGYGSNSQIFEAQTSALRYELGGTHEFEFVDGTYPTEIAPEIANHFPTNAGGLAYFDRDRPESIVRALDDLESFIAREGPYDGVIGFSHGAQVAASMLVRLKAKAAPMPIKCAIFLSAVSAIAVDVASGHVQIQVLDKSENGELIHLPVASIWGVNDTLYPGTSEQVYKLCNSNNREVYLHQGGHEVPSASMKDDLIGTVKIIRRILDKATETS